MRTIIYTSLICILWLAVSLKAWGQDTAIRTQINNSSVSIIVPENIRVKSEENSRYLPAFRVLEEPKNFVKIWTPRFTDKKATKAFAKESNSKLIDMFAIEINGQMVPMTVTYLKTQFKSGHVYKALFDDKNSIIVLATIFDDSEITREEVLEAFKTIEINVQNPKDAFGKAPFRLDLIAPFEFIFSSFNSLLIKSYPEIDESYRKPTLVVGYSAIFIYNGDPVIDSLQTAAHYLFPIDAENFLQTDNPNYSKVKIVSKTYADIGPGQAYKIIATYKKRMFIQYVWDIKGPSEFDDYLHLFAMGETKNLEPLQNEIEQMAASLTLIEK